MTPISPHAGPCDAGLVPREPDAAAVHFGPPTPWEERSTICLMDEAEALSAVPREEAGPGARAATVAPLHVIPVGDWHTESDPVIEQRPAMGLYIIDGRLLCQVGIGDRWSADLLGSGDEIAAFFFLFGPNACSDFPRGSFHDGTDDHDGS